MPLRHVVLLRFTDDTPPARRADLEAAFAALREQVPGVAALEWGTDVSPEGLSKGFSHCFTLTFQSQHERDLYLPHAAHQVFVERLKPHLADVLVLDYFA